MKRTPIKNQNYKIDILEHINQDHLDELIDISKAFGNATFNQVTLIDLFEEGMLVSIDNQEKEIPFQMKNADLHDNIEYLAYLARAKLGKSITNQKKQFFEVIDTLQVSPNMRRLVLKSDLPLEDEAGLAWSFELKTFIQQNTQISSELTLWQKYWNKCWTWGVKFLSEEKREKVFRKLHEGRRYYTARKVFQSEGSDFCDTAWVDIYLHGNTSGSLWAKICKKGDIIQSASVYHEQLEQVSEGKVVLIGDETALPTVLRILEKWNNPLSPVVISITAKEEDQSYFDEDTLPQGSTLYHITAVENVAQKVIDILAEQPQIDKIWGAFEHIQAKEVRQYVREYLKLSGKQNCIKGYWVVK